MTLGDVMEKVSDFISNTPLNVVEDLGKIKIFDAPLIGTASAHDPLFEKLKDLDVIGPNHMLPGEWLTGAQSVISYFLPFSEVVRSSNRVSGLPSIEWLYGRIEGEECNDALRRFLVSELEKAGYDAVAPGVDHRFATVNRRSNWSERHAAYISGLGTFGLNKSFITEKGCAGRYGSVITTLKLDPKPREYNDIYEYCTMCGVCIERCQSGAITEQGKNIPVCAAYIDSTKEKFKPRYGCGKCQTDVPCEYKRP